ncbi:MAG TPA: T3SS effector HopA1 family protein [Longimicrobium sp.]|nr:T3SS effector HopA1 family protein [Longimicrobium sp.]
MSGLNELRPALDAVEIVSPTALRFAGQPYERPAATPAEAAAARSAGAIVVPLLTEVLYGQAYARRFGAPPVPPPAAGPGDDLTALLRAAHPGRDRWEDGWEIRQPLSTGRVVAGRGVDARFLWPGEFVLADGPGMQPVKGARIRVWRPRESATLQPGFWFAFGAAGGSEELPLLRVYFNLAADAAPLLVAALVGGLDRHGVPFRFKCLSHRSLYPRTDAAVLYVARRHWAPASEIVEAAAARVGRGMLDETPLFTRRLAPGVALAEDPGGGESFGMHRCRLAAQGVWTAWTQGAHAPAARLAAVEEAFARGGVDPARPWRGVASPAEWEVAHAA